VIFFSFFDMREFFSKRVAALYFLIDEFYLIT